MKICISLILFLAACLSAPAQTAQQKPWTWWWVFGNSTTPSDIAAQLVAMKRAGIGGVCIIPVYGEKGDEANYVDLLSPRFMNMLSFVAGETKRLGMGFDMTMGSGWPFGGPWISEKYTAKTFGENLEIKSAKFKVKRSAPGGHGLTADPLNPAAYELHCGVFKRAFAPYGKKNLPRAFLNDSYEYSTANTTDDFFEQFKKRRGYDFLPYAQSLFAQSKASGKAPEMQLSDDASARLWQDYHATVAELVFDTMSRYASAARDMGTKSVYQAHGSPANLIDLYMLADIPETEAFGASKFDIPFVRQDPDYEEGRFGRPEILMMKFASSAANLGGKKLVASETNTWLANHFRTALSQSKPELDKLFLGGINHIFYHGWPYSPVGGKFPARMFYASVNFNQNAHFDKFFPLQNAYAARCQQILQQSENGGDVLLYFPVCEYWRESGGSNHVMLFDVHHSYKWIKRGSSFGALAGRFLEEAAAFDIASDAVLKSASAVGGGAVAIGSHAYKCLVVPECKSLPLETLAELKRLAESGANIVFHKTIPKASAGFFDAENRDKIARKTADEIAACKNVVIGDVQAAVEKFGAKKEPAAALGLGVLRKQTPGGAVYFLANQSQKFSFGEVEISADCNQLEYFDPLANERAELDFARSENGGTKFVLKLLSGQSCFIFANRTPKKNLPKKHFAPDSKSAEISGEWSVEFLKHRYPEVGGALPEPLKTRVPESWTKLGGNRARAFCGVARYTVNFDADNPESAAAIDLGDVRDACTVVLNGVPLGAYWCAPFRVELPRGLLKSRNTLEIEVQNNAFNLARKMSAQDPKWLGGNFVVDITYKKFRPHEKPLSPAGLCSPVRIVYR